MIQQRENELRERIVFHATSLFQRGYAPGTSGNISVKLDDGILLTPTNSCIGYLKPEILAKLDMNGKHMSGGKSSKEAILHLKVYEARPSAMAIFHLHSTHAVAVSCLKDLDHQNAIPALTPYYVMKIGSLPVAPYHPPGDVALADAVATLTNQHSAILLANHGPVVSGQTLDAAVYASEELEEAAKVYLLTSNLNARNL
ncbi:3-oxo-tetronate 4-phosphate decarboxylase [Chloroflexota bacterium]